MDAGAKLSDLDANAKYLEAWKDVQAGSLDGPDFTTINSLILQFLDLERPILQDTLADCLVMEGVLEYFIGLITRVKEEESKGRKL